MLVIICQRKWIIIKRQTENVYATQLKMDEGKEKRFFHCDRMQPVEVEIQSLLI